MSAGCFAANDIGKDSQNWSGPVDAKLIFRAIATAVIFAGHYSNPFEKWLILPACLRSRKRKGQVPAPNSVGPTGQILPFKQLNTILHL